jgi:hypothetical protein
MERERFDLQDAWAQVGELYGYIVALFGAPFAIAERLLLMRQTRRDLLSWLGPVEAWARRLLLLKALAMPRPNDAPPKPFDGRLLVAFTDRPPEAVHPESAKWRVRFCVMPYGVLRGKLHQDSAAGPAADRRCADEFNAVPLARRLEALRRVLENPAPAVARLCRLLAAHRDAVEYAFQPYRPRATCVKSALDEAQTALRLAFNSS